MSPPKKVERWIFSTLRSKSVIFFTSLNKESSTEENDTKIIEFGWVILILCPFLETQSFSNFAWFFATDEGRIVSGMAFHMMFWGSPWICVNKRNSISWKRAYVTSFRSMDFTKTPSERPFQIQFYAHQLQKSSEIWKWLHFKKWA